MLSLKNHPFAVEATFEKSIVLTFAIPKEEIEKLIPECLELDIFDNKYAFIAVAVVSSKNLRPKGFPAFMGNNFILVGYRVFVKYTDNRGKRLRGLYILKSETNKAKMSFFGNIFTHYNYTTTDISFESQNNHLELKSVKSNFNISINKNNENISLPETSPFRDWAAARRFAGPLPFTFTYNESKKEVLIIEGVRQNWIPKPIEILSHSIGFLDAFNFKNAVLANAFIIENIPYYWKKGKLEIWNKS